MTALSERIKSADWKQEKHVPVIECPAVVTNDEFFSIRVTIGKEIPHPNITEHHIRWISLFFQPEDSRTLHEIGNFEFSSHGESVEGPNTGPVYTDHEVTARVKLQKSGVIFALAYCNIHGLWQSSREISI